ncbi:MULTISPECIES: hypothetical protein [Mycolicibacterium]|uniref:hypothetical protein n=1 Tax=Mycolicibacterium TaxID=1866885 RepID=UPI001041BF8B|nr:hypothetical protein [Mycolicibacterium fortuitum]NOP99064.1 hypothetical protein [Mycolicibacterium fortuitum]UHJ57297.1 hypothetical protein LT337_11125 [Mycolicibacterium fortuitum]
MIGADDPGDRDQLDERVDVGTEEREVLDFSDFPLCLNNVVGDCRLGFRHQAGYMIVPSDDADKIVLLRGELFGMLTGFAACGSGGIT